MGLLSSIAISVLGGLFLVWGSRELQSAFILDFLRTNLLLLLPALMAINVTTSGVVMAKLRDLGDKHKAGFSSTISAIKSSFYEQTVLMIVATILLIIEGAKGSIA